MYLAAQQLEGALFKRLEQASSPAGLAHALRSVLQAHNSSTGVEWSSADGFEDQDQVQMDVTDSALSLNLEAWWTWLSRGAGDLQKSRYCAAAHVLIQGILGAIFEGPAPDVQRSALDTAWQADAGSSATMPKQPFVASLAALAHAVCTDGTPRAAAACLASLLTAVRGMSGRWGELLELYDGSEEAAAAGPRAVAEAAEQSDSTAAAGRHSGGAAPQGLFSRASSNVSAPTATAVVSRVAPATSAKSLGGPELAAELSGTSSNGLGDVPDDLDTGGLYVPGSKRPAQQPLLKGLLSSEEGKGNLADMPLDLRSWANLKDGKTGRAAGKPAGTRPGGGPLVPLVARSVGGGAGVSGGGDVGSSAAFAGGSRQVLDQHLKGGREPNPLHASIVTGSAARQSAERALQGQTSIFGRHGGSASPARERAISTSRNTSRKMSHKQSMKFLSVSEPAPTGPQAEWKNLPSLGQLAPRSHPHELRQQPSQGPVRGPSLHPEKLPSLPMSGARGQAPKAMEVVRRPSHNARPDSHFPDSHCAGSGPAHLPGLSAGVGNGKQQPNLRTMRLPSKQSFRGDRDF